MSSNSDELLKTDIKKDVEQPSLLEVDEWWKEHWVNMPEYIVDDKNPIQSIIIHFRSRDDVTAFAKLIKQRITQKTKYLWYPEIKKLNSRYVYVDEEDEEDKS